MFALRDDTIVNAFPSEGFFNEWEVISLFSCEKGYLDPSLFVCFTSYQLDMRQEALCTSLAYITMFIETHCI